MKTHYCFTLFFISMLAHSTYTMEITQSSLTSLYSLCKDKVIRGCGNTYTAQCKDALESITMIDSCMDEDFAKDFKHSFVHHNFSSLPCAITPVVEESPTILIKKNNKLYDIVDKDMYIWNLPMQNNRITGKKIDKLHCNRYRKAQIIRCALVSNNGSYLYTGADRGGIKVWNTQSGTCKQICTLKGSFWSAMGAFVENNNGDLCSTDISGKIRIWDLATQSHKQTLYNNYPNIIALTMLADTDVVYVGGKLKDSIHNGPIVLYDARTGTSISGLSVHKNSVSHLAKSKKDTQFYSSSYDKTIRIWDIRNLKESIHILQATDTINSIEENKEGTLLFSCGNAGVNTWDVTTGKPYIINTMTHEPTHCMVQDSDESQLFISTKTGLKILASDCTFDTACNIIKSWNK